MNKKTSSTEKFLGVGWTKQLVPVLIPLLLLIFTGLRGIDFGFHWDERTHALGVKNTISSGIPLPGIYLYPGVSYWLSLTSAVPDILNHWVSDEKTLEPLLSAIEGKAYRLRSRVLFLLISSLAVVFVYLTVLVWRGSILEAFLAASILGFSWEVAYHIRWIAPDGIMMQFGAMTLLGVIGGFFQPERKNWLWFSAIGAGLAFGSKWTAGLLLVPVLIVAYLNPHNKLKGFRQWVLLFKLCLVFFLVYLITTPATLLDSSQVFKYIKMQQQVYSSGLQGYAVSPGSEHFLKNLEYFALSFGSHFSPIAVAFFILSILGLYALVKESPPLALIFLSFPLLYLLYFSFHGMMVVRNLLVLGPFLAILSARGTCFIYERFKFKIIKPLVITFILFLLTINGIWLIYAGESIRKNEPLTLIQNLDAYISKRPDTHFSVSPQVSQALAVLKKKTPKNINNHPSEKADVAIFLASEMFRHLGEPNIPANRRHLTTTWFGPYEVNFNYYPTWKGSNRILFMPMGQARDLGFPFLEGKN